MLLFEVGSIRYDYCTRIVHTGVDGTFVFDVHHVAHIRVHTGVHVCVRRDRSAASAYHVTDVVVRPETKRLLLDGVRMHNASVRAVRGFCGGRPLAADGAGQRTVQDGQRDEVCGRRRGHVSGASARGHVSIHDRGHGAVPGVPVNLVSVYGHVPRGADATGVRRANCRHQRFGSDLLVWRMVRLRQLPRVCQRRRSRPWSVRRGEPPRAVPECAMGHRNRSCGVPVFQRRGHLGHHQALRRLESSLAVINRGSMHPLLETQELEYLFICK